MTSRRGMCGEKGGTAEGQSIRVKGRGKQRKVTMSTRYHRGHQRVQFDS